MKKRVLALLVSVSMMAVICTGCGEKETTGDDVKAPVEESQESAPAKESVAESVQESTEEVAESTEESAEKAEESVEASEEKVAEVVDADGKDWSTAYDDYFERENITPVNALCTAMASADGVSFELNVAKVDDVMMMSYDFDTASFEMYATSDKVYAHYSMGAEETWIWAPVSSDDEVSALTDTANTTIIDTENITESKYRETMEEDGVIYDVLDTQIDDGTTTSTAVVFVNRETQQISKCVMEEDGTSVVCLIEEIDTVEIPEAAANATEGTMEDVMGAMIGVMFLGAGAGMQ